MHQKNNVFKLKIGGVFILVKDNTATVTLNKAYKHFYTKSKLADLKLELHNKILPDYRLIDKCFEAEPRWKMYRSNGNFILNLSSVIAVMKSNFKSGDIYFENSNPIISPLGYPLGELIMINLLAKAQGIVMHCCGIDSNNIGLLFPGISGSGKSTISKLFDAQGVTVLSDDRVVIRKLNGSIKAYGTPWHGDAELYSNKSLPLKKVFFLKHGKKNEVKPINPTQAAALLVARSFPPYWDAEGMQNVLSLCTEIAQKITCHELSFVPDKSAVDFILNLINLE